VALAANIDVLVDVDVDVALPLLVLLLFMPVPVPVLDRSNLRDEARSDKALPVRRSGAKRATARAIALLPVVVPVALPVALPLVLILRFIYLALHWNFLSHFFAVSVRCQKAPSLLDVMVIIAAWLSGDTQSVSGGRAEKAAQGHYHH